MLHSLTHMRQICTVSNILSLLRIIITVPSLVLILNGTTTQLTIALILFFVAAASDYADGYLARKWDQVTEFGKFVDSLADKIYVLGVFFAFALTPGLFFPVIAVLILTLREVFITALRVEVKKSSTSSETSFTTSKEGKRKMAIQTLAILLLFSISLIQASPSYSDGYAWIRFIPFGIFIISLLQAYYSGYLYITKHPAASKLAFYKLTTTTLYTGYSKKAPGTIASVLTLLFVYFAQVHSALDTALILGLGVFGLIAAHQFEKECGIHDPTFITIDEVFGTLIALLPVLLLQTNPSLVFMLFPFIIYRLFDGVKPFGIKSLGNIKGGFGLMFDDFVSGSIAAVFTTVLILASPL